jgi:iron complex transport system ATP-binding protein
MNLSAQNVSFAYPGRRVLRDVSVSFPAGSVTAIVGPNGAGKSTLLRLLAGLRRPGSGSILLGGRNIASIGHKERSGLLAYLPQSPSLAFAFSVRQVVALGRFAAGRNRDAAERALARVGLLDRADEPFATLSAGQQQRAALARALAQIEPEAAGRHALALLADEPVSAMDPLQSLRTMDLLRHTAAEGPAVAVVLHDLSLAVRYADLAVMVTLGGQVSAAGPASEVLTPAVLEAGFGVAFRRLEEPGVAALVPIGPSGRVESTR